MNMSMDQARCHGNGKSSFLRSLIFSFTVKTTEKPVHSKGGFIIYVEAGMMILRAGESHDFLSTFFVFLGAGGGLWKTSPKVRQDIWVAIKKF